MRVLGLALLLVAAAAQQPRWQVARSRLATILFGISFVDENTGFVQGAQDGEGPIVLRSTDGGNRYDRLAHSGGTFMFMSGAAHSATSAAAAGLGILTSGVQYTTTGNQFVDANVPMGFPPIGTSQSGAVVKGRAGQRDGAFGFVGSFSETRGIAFTANGGSTWSLSTIPDAPAQARYGSYPTLQTWYVSGGRWPPRAAKKEDGHRVEISEHIATVFANASASTVEFTNEASESDSGYIAYITKTTDGGQTWQQVFFNDADGYYFNGIDCADHLNCLVVAEGRDGARLFGTRNGGQSWEQRLFVPGRSASLFDVKYVNAQEAWACGGILDLSFTGSFFHSVDGGNTWTQHPLPGVYGTTLSFVAVRGSYQGHATALTLDGQSSTLVYK
jgi:photosystem II stability/assembly factor-like uncharacterized protein